jgi:hypothetical protein
MSIDPIYDTSEEAPLSKKEILEIRKRATEFLRRRRRNTVYATIAFVFSCAAVTLFFVGFPLHTYWESFGRYLLLLTTGLLPVFVVYVGLLWSAWVYRRDIEREFGKN